MPNPSIVCRPRVRSTTTSVAAGVPLPQAPPSPLKPDREPESEAAPASPEPDSGRDPESDGAEPEGPGDPESDTELDPESGTELDPESDTDGARVAPGEPPLLGDEAHPPTSMAAAIGSEIR